MHIDVDGNDYWLWQAITSIAPPIVIMEYNALFGPDRAVTIPYQEDFRRHAAHFSGQYAGASLSALTRLAREKGYALVGTNSAGNNAYYVRPDWLNRAVQSVQPAEAFTASKFRDDRSELGRLTYQSYSKRIAAIKGLPLYDVITGRIEPF
jgi:hypothetical protein